MPQHVDHDEGAGENGLERATEWLNEKLAPIFGGPDISPDDRHEATAVEDRACPLCGHPMRVHTTEMVGGHTYYYHPDNQPPSVMEGDQARRAAANSPSERYCA